MPCSCLPSGLFIMETRLIYKFGLVIILLSVHVHQVESGECCKAHYDVTNNEVSNDQIWCDNYCCFNLIKYDCCNNVLLRAPENMRMTFCTAWFSSHIYVPVIVSLVILGLFVACCVCCCCGIFRNRHGRLSVQSQPPSVTVLTSPATANLHDNASSRQNPFNTGYDQ